MYKTAVIVLSDRVAAGEREDGCVPAVTAALGDGFEVALARVLPDEPADLQAALIELCDRDRMQLIVTAGGTGLGPRDRTPQATAAILDYEVPGISEAMRSGTAALVATAILSRAVAGVRGTSLILNVPGSPKAVRETLAVVRPVLPHALDSLAGAVVDG